MYIKKIISISCAKDISFSSQKEGKRPAEVGSVGSSGSGQEGKRIPRSGKSGSEAVEAAVDGVLGGLWVPLRERVQQEPGQGVVQVNQNSPRSSQVPGQGAGDQRRRTLQVAGQEVAAAFPPASVSQ